MDRGSPVPPGGFAKAIEKLAPPRGGTEIGGAIDRVFEETDPCDVLLITDGMSYALDVHRLAQEGRRVFVVLVGEDSLEGQRRSSRGAHGGRHSFQFRGGCRSSALHAALQGLRTKRMAEEQGMPAGGSFPNRHMRSGAMSA